MRLDELPTPAILVEKSRLAANIAQMQAKAAAQHVALRPHTKTHKSVYLAQQQVAAGAKGLTVAKVGEAELYAAAGFDDIRLAYTVVGADKHARLLRLMATTRISFCVDTEAGAQAASDFYAAHNTQAEVLMEVDCGYGRCGLPWDTAESIAFAQFISALPGLKLVGLLTHAGHAYNGPRAASETNADALRRVSAEERDRLLHLASQLQQAGVATAQPEHFEISIGSTPSMRYFENRTHDGFTITEIRPGNYVFNDAIQLGLGAATPAECALSVLTTVISKRRDANSQERLFLDAGKKVFNTDTGYATVGYGIPLYNARTMVALPHAQITGLSEEHGWMRVRGGATLEVGDRLRVIPNHACVVVNTQDQFYLVEGEDVVATWPVDGRGRVW